MGEIEDLEQKKKELQKEKQRYLMAAMEREKSLTKHMEELDAKMAQLEDMKKNVAGGSASNSELISEQQHLISQQHNLIRLLRNILFHSMKKDRALMVTVMKEVGMAKEDLLKLENYIQTHQHLKK